MKCDSTLYIFFYIVSLLYILIIRVKLLGICFTIIYLQLILIITLLPLNIFSEAYCDQNNRDSIFYKFY